MVDLNIARINAEDAEAQRPQSFFRKGPFLSSSRRMPGSSTLNRLDSSLRWNDGFLVERCVPEKAMYRLRPLRMAAAHSRISPRPLRLRVLCVSTPGFGL